MLLARENKPVSDPKARMKDPKWRFMWRMGELPPSTEYPEQNAAPVIPADFREEWAPTMNNWGVKLMNSVYTVAELLALGLRLSRDAFTKKMRYGSHLLGTDGVRYVEVWWRSRHCNCWSKLMRLMPSRIATQLTCLSDLCLCSE